jgi:hypothetical protein
VIKGYTPSPWQQNFHSRREDEVFGAGSAGPGKTETLVHDPFTQIMVEHERCLLPKDHPHYHPMGSSSGWCLTLRRTFPRLKPIMDRLHRIVPLVDPGARWVASDHMWIMSSGYKYQCGHCNDRNDWEQYMGFEFSQINFDELIEFEEEQYEQITSRRRSSDPILERLRRIASASNPVMTQHANDNIVVNNPHWVRDRFVKPWPDGNRTLKKRLDYPDGRVGWWTSIYLPATIDDNPNPAFVESYKRSLLSKPAHIRQALLYGNWWVTAGGYYAEAWNPRLHVCKPFRIPSDWPRFRSLDWGYKVPGVVGWFAMDPEGNLFLERELTFKGKTDIEVAHMIRDIERSMGLWSGGSSKITGPADDQLWEQRGSSARSMASVMAEAGVSWVKADKRSRARAAERLLKRLTDHDHETTTPGIVFFSTCTGSIQTIPSIQCDKNDVNIPADGGDDHWHDMVLYGCSYASHGRIGVPATSGPDDDEDDKEDADDSFRGVTGYGC